MIILKSKQLYYLLRGKFRQRQNKNISKHAFIAQNVQLIGIDNISIGENCTIGENTCITINDRTTRDKKCIIGKNSYIGRNNFISVGNCIEIGEYCMFGNNCSLISSDHIIDTPLIPYAITGASSDKKIYVGTNCWFGINVTVVGNVTIGHGSIIGANTVVTKDVPPFSMVVGNPSKVIKRYDFKLNAWIKISEVSDDNNESFYMNEKLYLEYLRNKFSRLPIAHYSSSSQFGNI